MHPAGSIDAVIVHPLKVALPEVQTTAQADYSTLQILVVEIRTSEGLVGFGEGLVRKGSNGLARLVEDEFAPLLIGQPITARRALWKKLRAIVTGREGGLIIEAIAAVDIALWDLAGKALGQPIYKLLGGMERRDVPAYASSINWSDDTRVEREIASALAAGFTEIKVKIGAPADRAIARAHFARKLVGDEVKLYADANWAYDLPDAVRVGHGLADAGFTFFEEPLRPDDREGYRLLARQAPIRLAAGESDYVASHTLLSLADRSLGLIQPDVARAGGITETWRMTELAAASFTAYAPHVGWSGALCEAASLHLAAAAETTLTFERMVFPNPLRDHLLVPGSGMPDLVNGRLSPPQGPGLGVEVDRDFLRRHRLS